MYVTISGLDGGFFCDDNVGGGFCDDFDQEYTVTLIQQGSICNWWAEDSDPGNWNYEINMYVSQAGGGTYVKINLDASIPFGCPQFDEFNITWEQYFDELQDCDTFDFDMDYSDDGYSDMDEYQPGETFGCGPVGGQKCSCHGENATIHISVTSGP